MSRKDNERALATLDAIDTYNQEIKNVNDQGSLLLSTFQDPNGNDTANRLKAIFCSNRIMDSIKELYYLNGTKENKDVTKWIKLRDINLLNYVPWSINKVVASDGTEYPSIVKDFDYAHKILKPFGYRRGNHLQMFDGFYYDDTYIMQRTITKVNKSFVRIKGTDALKDLTTSEWESSTEPQLPSSFKNSILSNPNSNAIKIAETLYYLNNKINLPDFLLDQKSYNDLLKPLEFYDETFTKEFANRVIAEAPTILFYNVGDKYILLKLLNKKIEKFNPIIKDEFKNYYLSANNSSKFYVYDEFENIYKKFSYKAILNYEIIENNLTPEEYDLLGTPMTNIEDSKFIKIVSSLKKELSKWFDNAKSVYDLSDKNSRCEEGNASSQYPIISSHLQSINTNNSVNQCNSFIDYVRNDAYPFILRRINYLNEYIIDEDNDKKLHNLLLKRLTKNTGSLLIWYQSLLQFDDSYENVNLTKELAEDVSKKTLVVRGYNDNGENGMFNTIDYPKYIDIGEIDPIYNGKEFDINDDIYIMDGNFNEQICKVVGKSITYIKEKDYSNVEASGFSEDISGVIEKTIPVVRLLLDSRLPKWCKVEDGSSILIMKKVK